MFSKWKRQSRIHKLTPRQAHTLLTSGENGGNTMYPVYRPMGLFYTKEQRVYVGIDNSTGHAWTEEFKSRRQCLKWLKGKD